MAAIDLLFDVKKNSERLHQIALGSLLIKTNLLKKLGFSVGPRNQEDFGWEPLRGLFDLSVYLDDNSIVWIEIKIDSDVRQDQIDRQVKHVNGGNGASHLLYLILGITQHSTNIKDLQKNFNSKNQNKDSTFQVCDTNKFLDCINQEMLEGNQSRDARDLLLSYREALTTLEKRGSNYSLFPRNQWRGNDFFGFYKDCKKKIPAMKVAEMNFVSNMGGGFWGTWFHFTKLNSHPDVNFYLQFAGHNKTLILCFMVGVSDKTQRKVVRDWAHNKVMEASKLQKSISPLRPDRFGNGEHMTVALIDDLVVNDNYTYSLVTVTLTHW